MIRSTRHLFSIVCLCLCATPPGSTADWLVNGGFESGVDGWGWTAWSSPWGGPAMTLYDGSGSFEGDFAVYLSAPSGSFGVYQEMCVEAGVPVHVEWAWKGQAPGTGWWEVLIVDAAYSYDAVDNPAGHPETFLASKWEKGFPNPKYPEPSAAWASGSAEVTPTSDVITVVLKCGSTEGGIVEAWFDAVTVGFDTQVLEVTSVTPAIGKAAGGDAILVTGRVFPEGATVTLGGAPLVDAIRWSTCEIRGATPPGEGAVDVVVTAPGGSATVPGGFRYVPPPTVSAVDPSSGPPAGGTDVTIRGAGFVGVAPGDVAVRIGGTALLETAVVDEGTITGKTPAGGAGPADVTVTTPFGEVTLAGGFTYVEAGVRFVRGDCDSDGELNITDGIAVLGFLFLGGNEPPCLEACNPDDGPELNISDGIGILNFLFLGGSAPALPYPGCGVDSTEGPTCLAGHPACG